ncbi:MAG: hypothetical protein CL936_11295 [Deltaproteobacteria bacterium]|nr:hypothetical protein [Deltaproteobacteria bacterium]
MSEAWDGVRHAWAQNDSGAPSAVIALATAAWGGSALTEMAERVAAEGWGEPAVMGASVEALEVGGAWWANEPAVALLALTGVEAHSFRADEIRGQERSVAAEWGAGFPGKGPGAGDLMIVAADGLSVATDSLLTGLSESLPWLPAIGFGATEPSGGPALLWCDDEVVETGCAGLLLRSGQAPTVDVVHPGTALCEPIPITRSRGAWIYGLGGRPALEVLAQYQGSPPDGPQSVWVGLLDPDSSDAAADPEKWVIRSLAGLDAANSAFCVPAGAVETGMDLVFLKPGAFSRSRPEEATSSGTNAGSSGHGEVCQLSLTHWPGAGGTPRPRIAPSITQTGALRLGASAAYQWSRRAGQTEPPLLHTHSSVVASLRG